MDVDLHNTLQGRASLLEQGRDITNGLFLCSFKSVRIPREETGRTPLLQRALQRLSDGGIPVTTVKAGLR
jgi:hypothetical protein